MLAGSEVLPVSQAGRPQHSTFCVSGGSAEQCSEQTSEAIMKIKQQCLRVPLCHACKVFGYSQLSWQHAVPHSTSSSPKWLPYLSTAPLPLSPPGPRSQQVLEASAAAGRRLKMTAAAVAPVKGNSSINRVVAAVCCLLLVLLGLLVLVMLLLVSGGCVVGWVGVLVAVLQCRRVPVLLQGGVF